MSAVLPKVDTFNICEIYKKKTWRVSLSTGVRTTMIRWVVYLLRIFKMFHGLMNNPVYINCINIPPIMIINRVYEHQNILSLYLVSYLVGLSTYQHPCRRITCFVGCISASVGGMANSYVLPYTDSFKTVQIVLRSVKLKGTLLAEECAFSALSELLEGISWKFKIGTACACAINDAILVTICY